MNTAVDGFEQQQTHCVRFIIRYAPSDVGVVALGIDFSSMSKKQKGYLLTACVHCFVQCSGALQTTAMRHPQP